MGIPWIQTTGTLERVGHFGSAVSEGAAGVVSRHLGRAPLYSHCVLCHDFPMSESPYSGYILDAGSRPDLNAPGGSRNLLLIAVARSPTDALQIGMHLGFPNCKVIEYGAAVLERAKSLSVNNEDARALPD